MATGGSKRAIYAAIGGNLLVSVLKFVASFFTGSSAMLSEGIHSLIDTSNGMLLLFGIKQSKREPDSLHPFGYGKEVYFWSFIVALLIFTFGGSVAIYEGIHHIIKPIGRDPEMVIWNYSVLFAAIVVESISFKLAFRQFRKTYPTGFIGAIIKSKDTATFAVIIEDSAAVVGLIIALIGVGLTDWTNNPIYDACSSIAIGGVLITIAVFLARETKGLLVGESALPEDLAEVNKVLSGYSTIKEFGNMRTMHLGPDEVLLAADLNFYDWVTAGEIEDAVREIKSKIKVVCPHFTQIYLETTDMKTSRGDS